MDQRRQGNAQGSGINGAKLGEADRDSLGETGGSSGGGTDAGVGDPEGGTADREADVAALGGDSGSALGEGAAAAAGQARSRSPAGAAHSMGEATGSGAGRSDVGKGTPPDRGDSG